MKTHEGSLGVDVTAFSALRVGERAIIETIEKGTVVFNSISGEYSAGYGAEHWSNEPGVMFRMDGGALVFYPLIGQDEDTCIEML